MAFLRLLFVCAATFAFGEEDCSVDDSLTGQSVNLLQTAISMGSPTKHKLKTDPDTTAALFKTFDICGKCNSFERFGDAHDGGYAMCADGLRSDSIIAAYSIGVFTHDGWADDVSNKLALPISQFDCTVSNGTGCKTCQFFKQCIAGSSGEDIDIILDESADVGGSDYGEGYGDTRHVKVRGTTLTEALSETGHATAPDGSILMKMDIEGSEWGIFEKEQPENLQKFGQLIMEFHWLDHESEHAHYLAAMQTILAAGFQVAHIHGNNCCGMYKTSNISFPRVVEVTFIRGEGRPGGCLDHQEYLKQDATNLPAYPETPLAFMG